MRISGNRFSLTVCRLFAAVPMVLALTLVISGESLAALRHNYLFNSGDGTTVVDSVPGGLNGTAIGGTIDTQDSRFVLDGVDNYVSFDGAALAINTYRLAHARVVVAGQPGARGPVHRNRWRSAQRSRRGRRELHHDAAHARRCRGEQRADHRRLDQRRGTRDRTGGLSRRKDSSHGAYYFGHRGGLLCGRGSDRYGGLGAPSLSGVSTDRALSR